MLKYLIWLFALILLMSSCSINEPKLPQWDTKWSIYLPLHDYSLQDAIKDQDKLYSDSTDNIRLNVSDSTDWHNIEPKDLSIKIDDNHFYSTFDEIDISKPVDQETESVVVGTILREVLGFDPVVGSTIPTYPAFEFSPPAQDISFDNFKEVDIIDGNFYITFHNKMFLTIDSGMNVNVYDQGKGDNLLATFVFPEIPAGESVRSTEEDLKDKIISNEFRLEYILPIAASTSSQVYTEEKSQGNFHITVSMSGLEVRSATAKIPAQDIDADSSVEVNNESHQVKRAAISRGSVKVTITNHLPISAQIEVTMPDIITQQGNQFQTNPFRIDANDSKDTTIDLSGYKLEKFANPGSIINEIQFKANAKIIPTTDYVTVNSDDSITVDVQMDTLFFSSFEGILDPVDMDFDEQTLDNFDILSDVEGKVRFDDLSMLLHFQNQIDFGVDVDVKIRGYHHEGGKTDSVIVNLLNYHIYKASESPYPDNTTIVKLDATSSTPSIIDLIELLPNEIKVSASGTIAGEGEVSVDKGVRVIYELVSPLSIHITEPLIYETNIDSLTDDELSEDIRENLAEDLLDVNVILNLDNGLPLAAKLLVLLTTDTTFLDTTLASAAADSELIIIDADIKSGTIGPDGYVVSSNISKIEKSLSKEQLQIFDTVPLYLKQYVVLPKTDNKVTFKQSDKIVIDGRLHFKTIINKEE